MSCWLLLFCYIHYSRRLWSCAVYVVAGIPSCSFPFTYNGGLHYACTNDMTNVSTARQPFACINANTTPTVCHSPGE